jgi:hypothetical protein
MVILEWIKMERYKHGDSFTANPMEKWMEKVLAANNSCIQNYSAPHLFR